MDVPAYTKYYIEQLIPWFDEVHVVTNEDRPVSLGWFRERDLFLKFYPNKGRDFEKYYYWMMDSGRQRVTKYSRLAFVNDCLICYGPLNKFMTWALKRPEELTGINSNMFPFYAIQSYFWVMQGELLGRSWDHFEKTGVVHPLAEIDSYELAINKLTDSKTPMFPQGKRRGWDEMFALPFEKGIPLVKHHCVMPRKPFVLKPWQRRVARYAHPDTKAWQYLPVLADKAYTHRSTTRGDTPHVVLHGNTKTVTVQQVHQVQREKR